MIRNRRKLLIPIVILSILIGGAITFTTPNKLACRVYLALLNPDLETISIYLSEHQEVSSVYYASPSSAQNGSSLFVLTMDDGEVRYSTGEQAIDSSINRVVSSYLFGTIRSNGVNVFFFLNRYSTHFSSTLLGIQYAPLDNPITFMDAPIQNEPLQDKWYYFIERGEILG